MLRNQENQLEISGITKKSSKYYFENFMELENVDSVSLPMLNESEIQDIADEYDLEEYQAFVFWFIERMVIESDKDKILNLICSGVHEKGIDAIIRDDLVKKIIIIGSKIEREGNKVEIKDSEIKFLSTIKEFFRSRAALDDALSKANRVTKTLIIDAFESFTKGYALEFIFITNIKKYHMITYKINNKILKLKHFIKPALIQQNISTTGNTNQNVIYSLINRNNNIRYVDQLSIDFEKAIRELNELDWTFQENGILFFNLKSKMNIFCHRAAKNKWTVITRSMKDGVYTKDQWISSQDDESLISTIRLIFEVPIVPTQNWNMKKWKNEPYP